MIDEKDIRPMRVSWRGLGKLIEECGEVVQICGKAIPYPEGAHPDGKGDIRSRLEEELGDLLAAITYVTEINRLNGRAILTRKEVKMEKFKHWGLSGIIHEVKDATLQTPK